MVARVGAWQEVGVDGVVLSAWAQESPDEDALGHEMMWGWWDLVPYQYEQFATFISMMKSVKDWGRLTDNFLWTGTSCADYEASQDWFNDAHWEIILNNMRVLARVAKELGFKGIFFDTEMYSPHKNQVWRRPWDYPLYKEVTHKFAGEETPRSFQECADQVRLRGRQLGRSAQRGISGHRHVRAGGTIRPGVPKRAAGPAGTWRRPITRCIPRLSTGWSWGLGDQATLVAGCEKSYLMSQYSDMAAVRDVSMQQSLVVSTVPEAARKRMTFSCGIWTDAGYGGSESYSLADPRLNQRSPERHRHAVHNALAVSDRYAWMWGEWLSKTMLLPDAPAGMREYWKANADGHEPMPLDWKPIPRWAATDYTEADAEAARADAAFWEAKEKEGYRVAAELPTTWKFHLDPELKLRYENWHLPEYDHRSWFSHRRPQVLAVPGMAGQRSGRVFRNLRRACKHRPGETGRLPGNGCAGSAVRRHVFQRQLDGVAAPHDRRQQGHQAGAGKLLRHHLSARGSKRRLRNRTGWRHGAREAPCARQVGPVCA